MNTLTEKASKSSGDTKAPVIHFPTEEENQAALEEFFGAQRKIKSEHRAAVEAARPALERLAQVLRGRSGQPYKVRALIYSLWNGQPTSLSELLALDWEIRKDLCALFLAFGFDDAAQPFWYEAIEDAVKRAGQWEWFLKEFKEEAGK